MRKKDEVIEVFGGALPSFVPAESDHIRGDSTGTARLHRCRSSFRDWAGNVSNFPRELVETALRSAAALQRYSAGKPPS
jgi:hypothetical protein